MISGFLESYLAYCGDSEVPRVFNYWAGISVLAAAMGDHVWYEKMPGQRLVPNLYVVLVGPSGLGKGQAINRVCGLSVDTPLARQVYSGKASGQFLADRLSGTPPGPAGPNDALAPQVWMPKAIREQTGRLFLVTEELGLAVGSGQLADGFVKYMTGLYTGSPLPFSDGTRMHGEVRIKSYCINWLAGSTEEWLIRSISQDAIEGGFFGRTVVIGGQYDFAKRIVRPKKPADYDVRQASLRQQLTTACRAQGPFAMSGLAADIETQWYEGRAVPEDERMLAGWKRQHDLVLKLAMVLAMSDYVAGLSTNMQIDSGHMVEAQQLAAASHQPLPKLISISNAVANKAMKPLVVAEKYLQKWKFTTHRKLVQKFGSLGLSGDELRQAVASLQEQGKIDIQRAGERKGLSYLWLGSKRPMPQQLSDDEPAGDDEPLLN